MPISLRKLGKTGVQLTMMGLGGEGVLRTYGREKEAYDLINRAIDLGIGYFESARAYSGSESYYSLAPHTLPGKGWDKTDRGRRPPPTGNGDRHAASSGLTVRKTRFLGPCEPELGFISCEKLIFPAFLVVQC